MPYLRRSLLYGLLVAMGRCFYGSCVVKAAAQYIRLALLFVRRLDSERPCGLPILGANEGGIPSVVRDGIDGILVEPGDVDGICDALRFFAADEDRRHEMGRAGRQRIEDEFTWQQVARRYEAIYNRVRKAEVQSGDRA